MDAKSIVGIFVGYSETSKAYRVWDPKTRTMIISRDVRFDEHSIPESDESVPELENEIAFIRSMLPPDQTESLQQEETATKDTLPITEQLTKTANNNEPTDDNAEIDNQPEVPLINEELVINQPSNELRRSKRIENQRRGICLTSTDYDENSLKEPMSYQEAITSQEANQWRDAVNEEYSSLIENETWTLAPLPSNRLPIKCKWIFKIKPGYNDIPTRYKARLVAKGYSQRKGIDYKETFAPVVKHTSLRLILAIASKEDLDMIQLDIKTAFLYGDLEEELYMEQPEGFIDHTKASAVCKLKKCIYGLKQAPRAWHGKFNNFLLKFGLTQSQADSCILFRHQEGEVTIVAIYVDDGLVMSNKKRILTEIIEYLSTHFQIRSLPADRFIGLDIRRDRSEKKIFISQHQQITKMLKRFNLTGCNPKAIPADPNSRLTSSMGPSDQDEIEAMTAIPYREAIGCLMYIMVLSRPDVAFAVSQVAQHCQNPGPAHWRGVTRIFSYLHGTSDYELCFDGNAQENLIGYTDADYAGDLDTRKSTSGYIFIYQGGAVSWASRRQQCTSLSTTESEFVAACETAKEAVWIQRLLSEIRPYNNKPVPIRCDNQSSISLIRNPEHHQKTKHIEVKYFFVRDQQNIGNIDVTYIGTADQLADILTKPLPRPRLEDLRTRIGVIPFKP